MTAPAPVDVDAVVAQLERRIREHRSEGTLERDAVEALDVVYHALVFTGEPGALEHWRQALWRQRLAPETRRAVARLLEYLNVAVAAGEGDRVSEICDCLHTLFAPPPGETGARQAAQ